MSNKPIFLATHPRSCSTAFERVFMTQRNKLATIHEPFGDAFYFGPERMSARFEEDEEARVKSGFSKSTYKTIIDNITREGAEGKRVFIKDITYYLLPPDGQTPGIAPSLLPRKRGIGTETNGVSGTNGAYKTNGINGTNGTYETNGINGTDGTHKTNGINGTNGDYETNGINGADGIYETNGIDGTNGKYETNGINGTEGTHETNGTNGHIENGTRAPFPYNTIIEPGNPTIIPEEFLKQFHFAFLIRNPHSSIPSYYRCTIPPLDKMTGFYEFYPNESGYDELRRFFDYLKSIGLVGPAQANLAKKHTKGTKAQPVNIDLQAVINGEANDVEKEKMGAEICIIDADDLLDDPEAIIQAFCASVGLDYDPSMLTWDNAEDQEYAKKRFAKWKGFHEDAIDSEDLKPRTHKKNAKTEEEWDVEWRAKYGEEGARVIRETVDAQMADYEYLKGFAVEL